MKSGLSGAHLAILGKKEAKWNFATHSDLSIEITDPKKTFETMIGDVIDTFSNTTPVVNQKFVQKSQIETNTCHRVSHSKSWPVNHVFPSYAICSPML